MEPRSNLERFSGFADIYHRYRPQPPETVVDFLCQFAGIERPRLVVDLGSGTGLSTTIWADRAEEVIGIEPNADMRAQALSERTGYPASNVRYIDGLSSSTGLPTGCADIVTASQALHWMEPKGTFAEVARILRPGGIFAAFDCDWPPTVQWQAEAAYDSFIERGNEIRRERDLDRHMQRWWKNEHLERMNRSGLFRYTRESALHHVEYGNAERLVGVAISQGSIAELLQMGMSETEIGLDTFRAEATRVLGEHDSPWYWTYRIRVGVV